MKNVIVVFLLFIILKPAGAQTVGIKFEQGLTWAQIQQKAKEEHKCIFVDCYATWCGPCKAMDQNVYTNREVGDAVNPQFISVTVQMNRTQSDDTQTKSWYSTTESFEQYYGVTAYPTFLFFNAEGKPLHKIIGYKESMDFIKIVADAQNPDRQYYNVLDNFRPGKIDTVELKGLARSFHYSDSNKELAGKLALDYLHRIPSKDLSLIDNEELMVEFKDDPGVLAFSISYLKSLPENEFARESNLKFVAELKSSPEITVLARAYVIHLPVNKLGEKSNLEFVSRFSSDTVIRQLAINYINELPENEFFTKAEIRFLTNLTDTVTDRGFAVFYRNTDKVNATMGNMSYAQSIVQYLITRSEVDPLINAAKINVVKPDFDFLLKEITRKYNWYYAQRIVPEAKLKWLSILIKATKIGWQKYLPEVITNRIHEISIQRTDTVKATSNFINNVSWLEICLCSEASSSQVHTAIEWMRGIVNINPRRYDYLDTYACLLYKVGQVNKALDIEEKAQRLSPNNKSINLNLAGMKSGEKIWLLESNRLERDRYFGH